MCAWVGSDRWIVSTETCYNNIFNNQVPSMWEGVNFLSIMPLASWYVDLLRRMDFINGWCKITSNQEIYDGTFFSETECL